MPSLWWLGAMPNSPRWNCSCQQLSVAVAMQLLNVSHALVSRQHTEIFERDGRLFVRDLGSLNGTFVNNKRINDEQPLDPDQLLTLGNTTFRAVYEYDSSLAGQDVQTKCNANESTARVATTALQSASPFNGETVPMDSLLTALVPSVDTNLASVQSVTQNGIVNLAEGADQASPEPPVVRPR